MRLLHARTIVLVGVSIFLTSCVSLKDIDKETAELNAKSAREKVYSTPKDAGQALSKNCVKADEQGRAQLKFTPAEPLVVQNEKGAVGYFRVVCFDNTSGRTAKIKIIGKHRGGGYGRAFYVMPRVSLYNSKWALVNNKLPYLKHNKWTGHLESEIDLPKDVKSGYIVVEADNRNPKIMLGSYEQYGGVPFMIVDIDMLSSPIGEAELRFAEASSL